MPHFVVDISSHGFGHAAMVVPVLNALWRARPDIRATVRSGLPRPWLQERIAGPFEYIPDVLDFGMVMEDSIRVKPLESLAAYEELHRNWPKLIQVEAKRLKAIEPDLLCSNVSYISLAAASSANIKCVGYSSLNWADIFMSYCGYLDGARAIHAQMRSAYAEAEIFIQPEPSMDMPSITNAVPVGPVARLGVARQDLIRTLLRIEAESRIVLVSMGGIPTAIDFDSWPRLDGIRVISGSSDRPGHPDVTCWLDLGLPFIDILASCDAAIIKPGYGLFVESACNGIPILYIPRDEWPETPAEVKWLERNAVGRCISEAQLRAGNISEAIGSLISAERRPIPIASGIAEIVDLISQRI